MTYNLLYVNGDSFAAGHNLANKHLFPESDYFKAEFTKHNGAHSSLVRKIESYISKSKIPIEEIVEKEKQLSFAALVGKKIGIEYLNSARRGSGIQEICYSTLLDLEQLRKTRDISKTFVIVFLTSMFRNIIPDNLDGRNFSTILPGHRDYKNKSVKNYIEYFYTTADNDFHALSAWSALSALEKYFQDHNINYAFFDSYMYSESIIENNLDRNIFPTANEIIDNWYGKEEKILLYCNHFNEKVHNDIADKVIEKYLNWK